MFGGLELLLIPVLIWMYLKVRQGKKINNIVKELEESGQIYFGQDGGGRKPPKVIIFVSANRQGEIVEARMVRLMRFFKPANTFDLPEIKGKKIEELAPSRITKEIELKDALKDLKKNYTNLKSEKEPRRIKVKSKRIVKR